MPDQSPAIDATIRAKLELLRKNGKLDANRQKAIEDRLNKMRARMIQEKDNVSVSPRNALTLLDQSLMIDGTIRAKLELLHKTGKRDADLQKSIEDLLN